MSAQQLLETLVLAGQAAAGTSEDGQHADRAGEVAGSLQLADVQALQKLARSERSATLWAPHSASDVGRGLIACLQSDNSDESCLAAATFGMLLGFAEAPVTRIFNAVSCEAFLRVVTTVLVRGGSRRDADGADGDEAMEVETGPAALDDASRRQLCAEALAGFAVLLETHGLAEQPDILRSVAEVLAEVARSKLASKQAAGSCYAALLTLMAPRHGASDETASLVLRLVTPALLAVGTPGSGGAGESCKTSNAAPTKEALTASALAREFVSTMLRVCPASCDAVAALARLIVIKAPDKADFRALATDTAVDFVKGLPPPMQTDFCVFLTRLSRTPKVAQRTIAVDLAPRMFKALLNRYTSPPVLASPNWSTPGAAAALAGGRKPPSTGSSFGSTPASGGAPATSSNSLGAPTPLTDPASGTPQCARQAPPGATCLAVLLQRCSDKSAAVRARALANLAALVTEHLGVDCHNFRRALASARLVQLHQPLGAATPGSVLPMLVSPAGTDEPGATPMRDSTNSRAGPLGRLEHMDAPGSPLSGGRSRGREMLAPGRLARLAAANAAALNLHDLDVEALVHTARRRAADEKAGVRKAGVALLEALLRLRASPPPPLQRLPGEADVAALAAAASDPLVSVRRAALVAASRLNSELPSNTSIAQLWVTTALPMVRDAESSLQEAALEQVHELLLGRAAAAGKGARAAGPDDSAAGAARLLRVFLARLPAAGAAMRGFLGRGCAALKAKGRLPSKAAAVGLEAIVGGLGRTNGATADAEESGAWLLLAEVAAQDAAATSWQFLQARWASLQSTPGSASNIHAGADSCMLLRIIAAAASRFPPEEAASLSRDLLKAVRTFTLPVAAVAAHMRAIAQLAPAGKAGAQWHVALLSDAERELSAFVSQAGGGSASGDRHDPVFGSRGNDGSNTMSSVGASEQRAATAVFTVGEAALLQGARAPGGVVVLVQALTAGRLMPPGGSAAGSPAAEGASVRGPLQAHAWTALGKLCLVDERLAKACVPHFARQLRAAPEPAVRNNIAVGLTDLCITCTGLVDAHVPRLAACLGDEHELVRCQALALLSHLLQKDFVKWRGPLFQRFLLALVDESPRVRALAEFLLGDTLATKAPLLAYNHFVETVYSLNDCREGIAAGVRASQQAEQPASLPADGAAADVRGSSLAARAKRDTIYRALLQRMSPEHKFSTAARLSGEVLGGVADESLSLAGAGEVLADALRILASKHIRVAPSRTAAAAEDEPQDPSAVAGAARGRVVNSMMRKHLIANVVPVAIQLKAQLEAARHALLGDLMAALAALLAENKHEMEDILAADPQLAKELLFDIRQAEAARRAAAAAPASARPAPNAPPDTGGAAGPRWGAPRGSSLRTHRISSGGLPDTPAAADALAGDGPGSASRLQQRSGGSAATPRGSTPRAALQTPAPHRASAGALGATFAAKSPVLSVPRLRGRPGGSARRGAAPAARAAVAESASENAVPEQDEAQTHVVVREPAPPTPWRISGAGLQVKEEEQAAGTPQQGKQPPPKGRGRPAGRGVAKKRKKAA